MKAIDKHPVRLIFISHFLFSQLPSIGQNVLYLWVCGRCLGGVWEVSGGCLSDSGCCQEGYDVQETNKHPTRLIFISLFLFSQLPRIGQNMLYFGVSVGCLEGVWEVPRVV